MGPRRGEGARRHQSLIHPPTHPPTHSRPPAPPNRPCLRAAQLRLSLCDEYRWGFLRSTGTWRSLRGSWASPGGARAGCPRAAPCRSSSEGPRSRRAGGRRRRKQPHPLLAHTPASVSLSFPSHAPAAPPAHARPDKAATNLTPPSKKPNSNSNCSIVQLFNCSIDPPGNPLLHVPRADEAPP